VVVVWNALRTWRDGARGLEQIEFEQFLDTGVGAVGLFTATDGAGQTIRLSVWCLWVHLFRGRYSKLWSAN
jgi:hypothetical protein